MPVKPVISKETSAKETARPARKTTSRVGVARHRSSKKTETTTAVIESSVENNIENSQEVIAGIAYGYWESRGYQGGDAFDDWVRAEQEYNGRGRAMAAAV
jgi:hypothetical protein